MESVENSVGICLRVIFTLCTLRTGRAEMPDLLSFSDGVLIFQVHLMSGLCKWTQKLEKSCHCYTKCHYFPTAIEIMSLLHLLILINQSLVIICIFNHLPSQPSAWVLRDPQHSCNSSTLTPLYSPNLLPNLWCFTSETNACYSILASVKRESKAFSLPQSYFLAFFLYLLPVEHNCFYR